MKKSQFIRMPGNRYVPKDNFTDLEEAAQIFSAILQRHFATFDGYSNNRLLFGAASNELSMFLNDNDCDNRNAVYAVAKFLFKKYKFHSPHIFETKPNYPMSLKGLMINLAEINDGILNVPDAKNYIRKIRLARRSFREALKIRSSDTFFMHDKDKYLLSKALGIDETRQNLIHERLEDLFRTANVAYVIPRDLKESWLETLPPLPQNLKWTHLLLQEVIRKHPAIGFKTISAKLIQPPHTLAAAFVPTDSPLQTFADIVTLFMEEHRELPLRISDEELRRELRAAGMLRNQELQGKLPKVLADYRFAWSRDNKTVYVRGNK